MASKQQQLKKKLDKVFSLWIRQKDANDSGYVTCVTCGKTQHWKKMHAGHYVPRNNLATRWDDRNVEVQCPGCNLFGNGKPDEFAIHLLEKHGGNILNELNREKHKITKLYVGDYEHLIGVYERKLEEL